MSEDLRGSFYSSSPPEVRLVLLGNIGCGKTLSADTILGQLSSSSSPSASRSCQLRQAISDDRNVTLVEAPRWYWTGGKMEESVRRETQQAMTLVAPGLHAILLLVPVNQFTEMDRQVPAEMKEMFGEEVLDHTLVLLTCGDYLMGKNVEDYLQKEHPDLRQIIEQCGGRYHVINNRQRHNREQVQQLLQKVDSVVKKNGLFFLRKTQERELATQIKERKPEFLESYRVQEERRETVASSHTTNTKTQRSVYRGKEYTASLERTREEKDRMEGRVDVSPVKNGLYSTPAQERQACSELHNDREVMRTPSFRPNADDAMLSHLSEVKSSQRQTTVFHHKINSSEDQSTEASPTLAPQSPVFSSSSSSPTVAFSPSAIPSSTSFTSSSPELRLVLLGRSGSGKSTAGNIILGSKEFESCPESFTAITQECEKKKTLIEGRQVAVVDTPDWFNSEKTPDEVRAQISACVTLSSPGPHAFLFCVPLDMPAKTELQALGALESVFGLQAVQRHTLVLFTYADRLRESEKAGNDGVEAYIAHQRGDLLKIVEKCRDRFHILELDDGWRESHNVAELLEKVDQTVKEAGGQCYSCPAFQEAENRVRQRQVEIARERKGNKLEEERRVNVRQLNPQRRVLNPYMQPVAEAEEEEVKEDEIEKTRDEAEMSVRTTNIESLPLITLSTMSPSLVRSIMEKFKCSAQNLPKLLADSSMLVSKGATKVKSSPVWGTLSSGAHNVPKMVINSSVWKKVGASAGHMSKQVGDRVPKVVLDNSAWVGSGAKAAAASPMWEKVGSGAKLVADSSLRVGAGLGSGARNLAQSSVWGKVGSVVKNGAKLVAQSSVQVGDGIGSGAKKVTQSPVWGKVGSGAKAGAKMVSESPVWEKIETTAKKVPKVVIGGALLGLVLGIFFGGVIGGAVGAAVGSAISEVGRRKLSSKSTLEKTDEAAKKAVIAVNNSVDSRVKQGEKVLKTE